jgi:hypothetical protein
MATPISASLATYKAMEREFKAKTNEAHELVEVMTKAI